MRLLLAIPLALLSVACEVLPHSERRRDQPEPAATSLLGEALFPLELEASERQKREDELARAQAAYEAAPGDADALIWYGRRLAHLGRYREAIDVFTRGIAEHPLDPRAYRHRGHRWITLRRFAAAEEDLQQAARLVEGRPDEPEPPLAPNARGVVVDTLNHSVFYHLALARYLRRDFEGALSAWRECLSWSKSPDSLCSATHWTYMTLRRLGREQEAFDILRPIRADLDVAEYHAYHRLCLMYRGELSPAALWDEIRAGDRGGTDFATIGYGIGNWHYVNGRPGFGTDIWREVVKTPMWAAFGRIAAEAELANQRAD